MRFAGHIDTNGALDQQQQFKFEHMLQSIAVQLEWINIHSSRNANGYADRFKWLRFAGYIESDSEYNYFFSHKYNALLKSIAIYMEWYKY